MCEHHSPTAAPLSGLDRRSFLGTTARAAGLAGAVAAGVATASLAMTFEPAAAGSIRSRTWTGRFTGVGTPDWHYVPFHVPQGVGRIEVSYHYESTPTPFGVSLNVIDIGMFDPSGTELGNAAGFRGWSGGARRSFHVSPTSATPGYLPGPITPGRWHVILGPFAIVPPGVDWKLTVTLHFGSSGPEFEPMPAPRAVPGTGRRWYRGDMHLHTVHSDGTRTPAEMVAAARAAGLDFVASTEHNTCSAGLVWGSVAPADFLVVNGEEVTTRNGHWLAVGLPAGAWVDWRYRVTDRELSRFTEQARRLGGLAVVAHPSVPIPSTGWTFGSWLDADAVEVWNGPWTEDDEGTLARWHELLVAGRFLPAVGSSDSHRPDQPVGLPQTVVLADSLSTAAIVETVKAGRAWIAESSDVHLSFHVTGPSGSATCGERLAVGPTDTVRAVLRTTGVPGCVATLVGPAGPLASAVADGAGSVVLERDLAAAAVRFVRAEVRRPAGSAEHVPPDPTGDAAGTAMVALTNPVFVAVER